MNNRIGNNLVHFAANNELVRILIQNGVKFVVVGGLAMAWHCPERQADDMDILIDPTPQNSAKVAVALAKLRLQGFTPESFSKQGLQVPLKGDYYAELLTPRQDGMTFAEVEANSVQANLFNIPIRLASIKTLILMKKYAALSAGEQQTKHLKDIELLKKYDA
jgi:hypothetical protein